ncbi:MAG TPA: segregation/condensation protein A [Bacteroidetes bacterium]|nr:segregation/condensation protein A [Bacteroidota bacterium]
MSETETIISENTGSVTEYIPKSREYYAKLPEFEGPLDILLHFVKEDELNIYDIPISKITKDFIGYIDYIQELDIEVAGEFLLMAAELMKIKARMLIPQEVADESGFEEDPRYILVKKLLEYKRFKDASDELLILEQEAKLLYARGYLDNDPKEFETDIMMDKSLKNLTILNLIKGYRNAVIGFKPAVVHPIEILDITTEVQKDFVMDKLQTVQEIDFEILISQMKEKLEVICTFLCVLQMALDRYVELIVDKNDYSKFKIRKRSLLPALIN